LRILGSSIASRATVTVARVTVARIAVARVTVARVTVARVPVAIITVARVPVARVTVARVTVASVAIASVAIASVTIASVTIARLTVATGLWSPLEIILNLGVDVGIDGVDSEKTCSSWVVGGKADIGIDISHAILGIAWRPNLTLGLNVVLLLVITAMRTINDCFRVHMLFLSRKIIVGRDLTGDTRIDCGITTSGDVNDTVLVSSRIAQLEVDLAVSAGGIWCWYFRANCGLVFAEDEGHDGAGIVERSLHACRFASGATSDC